MMLPNQITLQTFTQTGKGGYKSTEVDAFVQRVYQSYNKLYNDNKSLCEKLDATLPLADEYNKIKNSIADALILAKSTAEKNVAEACAAAEKLVSEATEKADRMYNEKKAEADDYYSAKVSSADEKVVKAEAELESLRIQAESFSEKYIADVNSRVQLLIEDANTKAASIVADAYADAKSANEKAEAIIADANKQLNSLKVEAAKIKNEILTLISIAQEAAESVNNRIFEPVALTDSDKDIIEAEQLDVADFEAFTLDDVQVEVECDEVIEEESEPAANNDQPEFVRLFDTQVPEVDDILSGIFASLSEEKAKKSVNEDDNSFRFTNIFADPSDMGSTRRFDPITKDSE